jgi:hypothetical protein
MVHTLFNTGTFVKEHTKSVLKTCRTGVNEDGKNGKIIEE